MRILFDECMPKRLKKHLAGHAVSTVPEMGWSGTRNGALLQLIAAQSFEVFVTVDQNMAFQQKLQGLSFAIVVVIAPTNRMADLVPLMPAVNTALGTVKPGDIIEIRP